MRDWSDSSEDEVEYEPTHLGALMRSPTRMPHQPVYVYCL